MLREFDHDLLRSGMKAVRLSLPLERWDALADAIAADRRPREAGLRKAENEIDRTLFGRLDEFLAKGFIQVPVVVPSEMSTAVREYFEASMAYTGSHVYTSDRHMRPLAAVRGQYQLAGYTMDQVLRAPYLTDLFNFPPIVDFIELYLGCVPTLYSVNAWWSFPAPSPKQTNVQYFHRDNDDWRFCALFLYLTDVNIRTGPHQIIAGSHTLAGMQGLVEQARRKKLDVAGFDVARSFTHFFGEDFSQRCETLFADATVNVVGTAGSMVLVNTKGLHRGLLPQEAPRLMAWARYGLGPNTNSADLEQGPLARVQVRTELPDTPRNRYVNRLLFEYDRGPYFRTAGA
jgi:hypothetical protein